MIAVEEENISFGNYGEFNKWNNDIKCIAYGDNKWVACGSYNNYSGTNYCIIVYSVDNGETWLPVTYKPYFTYISDIAYGDGRWIVDGSGTAYSDNVTSWNYIYGDNGIEKLGWGGTYGGNGKWIFGGWYSDDNGETWKESYPYPYSGIAYGNGRWVAVGSNGVIEYTDW